MYVGLPFLGLGFPIFEMDGFDGTSPVHQHPQQHAGQMVGILTYNLSIPPTPTPTRAYSDFDEPQKLL